MPRDLILEAFWSSKLDPMKKWKTFDFACIYNTLERLAPSKIVTFSHFFRYPENVSFWTPFLSIFEPNGVPLGLPFSSKSDQKTHPKKHRKKTLKINPPALRPGPIFSQPSPKPPPILSIIFFNGHNATYTSVHAKAFHCASRHPPAFHTARSRAHSPSNSPLIQIIIKSLYFYLLICIASAVKRNGPLHSLHFIALPVIRQPSDPAR